MDTRGPSGNPQPDGFQQPVVLYADDDDSAVVDGVCMWPLREISMFLEPDLDALDNLGKSPFYPIKPKRE